MKTTPKIDSENIKNGIGNRVLFFVGLEGWKMEAWGLGEPSSESTGVQLTKIDRPSDRDEGFWWCGGEVPPN